MSRKPGPSSVMQCLQGIISGRPRDYQCTEEHAALVDAEQDGLADGEPRPGKRVVPTMLTFADEPSGHDSDQDTPVHTPSRHSHPTCQALQSHQRYCNQLLKKWTDEQRGHCDRLKDSGHDREQDTTQISAHDTEQHAPALSLTQISEHEQAATATILPQISAREQDAPNLSLTKSSAREQRPTLSLAQISASDSDQDKMSALSSEPGTPRTPRTLAELAAAGTPSPSGADSGSEMLGASMSDRHLAYLERKKQRRSKRNSRSGFGGSPISPGSTSTLDTHGFLSHLPEVNADIAYRYCFTVVAYTDQSAQQIIEAVCSPEVADVMNLPTPSSSSAGEAFRCLCPVPFDNEKHPHKPQPESGNRRLDPAKFSSDVPKLAKLIFSPLAFGDALPVCRTRFEALSSALVCVLTVDPKVGEPSFHEQLLEYERTVDALLFVRKPLRPARAIVLVAHRLDGCEEVEPPRGHMRWTERLAEYEMCVEENLWKFGPVDVNGSQDILAVFGTIASQRIMRSQCSHGEDSDGSQQSDPPPLYEAECDPDWDTGTIEEEPEIWMAQLGPEGLDHAANDEPGPDANFTRQPWLNAMQRGAA